MIEGFVLAYVIFYAIVLVICVLIGNIQSDIIDDDTGKIILKAERLSENKSIVKYAFTTILTMTVLLIPIILFLSITHFVGSL
jgi:hypothetical protein